MSRGGRPRAQPARPAVVGMGPVRQQSQRHRLLQVLLVRRHSLHRPGTEGDVEPRNAQQLLQVHFELRRVGDVGRDGTAVRAEVRPRRPLQDHRGAIRETCVEVGPRGSHRCECRVQQLRTSVHPQRLM